MTWNSASAQIRARDSNSLHRPWEPSQPPPSTKLTPVITVELSSLLFLHYLAAVDGIGKRTFSTPRNQSWSRIGICRHTINVKCDLDDRLGLLPTLPGDYCIKLIRHASGPRAA